ncbi:CGNR zinc finger domain-containing protein [Actinocorallia sp. API 0066]|uniref:CGNR zinc finger domain-containing protein n=1 Tax=Actinocorallia sp. API 0066 TaxID=2896846 RepID=UPI001E4C8401|nr:CGNR zinc finger domain-containing protein [Actinocorallia sp. API 0066]MCD0450194.1 CGNR zinc finger domain-containing protein [Actinocorallia sp. API 0066]
MIFTHDTEHALDVMVNLVNSAAAGAEGLPDTGALAAFVETGRFSDVPPVTDADLETVRGLRARFREIFAAPAASVAVPLVNGLLAEVRTAPYLTDHDGYDWHVHFFAPGSRVGEHLAVECGMALAYVVAAGELDRLRACAADGCDRVLVDLSRNRCRRFCDSRTCGNRAHVAAYRARRKAG